MNDFLRLEGLKKSYFTGDRELPILKGVSLSIAEGEIVAVVGPSGAGKSTLLHIMGFLDRPTEGSVVFKGRPVSGLSDAALAEIRNRSSGFIYQTHHLMPDLNALENVVLPLMIRTGMPQWVGRGWSAYAKARELLERLGLKDRLYHRPHQLSGGERQRIAFARALIGDPDMVLCDEPTGSLDAATSKEIQQLIVGLAQETRKTFVIVTHDMRVAGLARRVVRIEDGLIVSEGRNSGNE